MGVEWPDPQPWPSPPPPPSPKPAWPRVVVALVAAALGALLVIPVLALLRGDLDPSTRAGNTAIESATPAATAEAAELATGVVDIATNLRFDRSRGAGSGMVITPTGTVLRWRLTSNALTAGPIPFLISRGETPHPAASAPSGLALESLHIEHPDPASLRGPLHALGAHVEVHRAPKVALVVRLRGPRCIDELR